MVKGRYRPPTMTLANFEKNLAIIAAFARSRCSNPALPAAAPIYAAAMRKNPIAGHSGRLRRVGEDGRDRFFTLTFGIERHLTERFTRRGPDTIDYQVTIDDPTTRVKPWTGVVRLRAQPSRAYELAMGRVDAAEFRVPMSWCVPAARIVFSSSHSLKTRR